MRESGAQLRGTKHKRGRLEKEEAKDDPVFFAAAAARPTKSRDDSRSRATRLELSSAKNSRRLGSGWVGSLAGN